MPDLIALNYRIRLVPDALGAIDVSVKSVGGALHVHFAAESSETRALIEGAAPRLAAIAEERGLRIGQTTVEAAAAAASQQQAGNPSQGNAQTPSQNPSPSQGNASGQQQATGQAPSGQAQSGQAQSGQPQAGQQQPRQQSSARQPERAARTTPDRDAADDGRVA